MASQSIVRLSPVIEKSFDYYFLFTAHAKLRSQMYTGEARLFSACVCWVKATVALCLLAGMAGESGQATTKVPSTRFWMAVHADGPWRHAAVAESPLCLKTAGSDSVLSFKRRMWTEATCGRMARIEKKTKRHRPQDAFGQGSLPRLHH